VYASIHSAFANSDDVVVDVDVLELVMYVDIVGIRDYAAPTMLGRAVRPKTDGATAKTAIKPIVLFRKDIRLTPLLITLL